MEKEIAVGHTVERIAEQYSCFNPYTTLSRIYSGLSKDENTAIHQIRQLDTKLKINLTELYRDLLRFRRGNVTLKSMEIIDLLKNEYAPLINSLSSEQTQLAKIQFNEWKLEWMLNYLRDSVFYDDEFFAESYSIPVTKETKAVLKTLRELYFTEDEIIKEWGEEYLDDEDDDYDEYDDVE